MSRNSCSWSKWSWKGLEAERLSFRSENRDSEFSVKSIPRIAEKKHLKPPFISCNFLGRFRNSGIFSHPFVLIIRAYWSAIIIRNSGIFEVGHIFSSVQVAFGGQYCTISVKLKRQPLVYRLLPEVMEQDPVFRVSRIPSSAPPITIWVVEARVNLIWFTFISTTAYIYNLTAAHYASFACVDKSWSKWYYRAFVLLTLQ